MQETFVKMFDVLNAWFYKMKLLMFNGIGVCLIVMISSYMVKSHEDANCPDNLHFLLSTLSITENRIMRKTGRNFCLAGCPEN